MLFVFQMQLQRHREEYEGNLKRLTTENELYVFLVVLLLVLTSLIG